jgi:tRNA threonylcarbamoyl adenosine modification protein YeaZ
VSSPRLLALDGALGGFSAAVVSADGEFYERTPSGDALERGLAAVAAALAAAGLRFEQLDALAVGTGPGGFTGLRIAVSFAKSLAFARGLPLIGISSYDALEGPGPAEPRVTSVAARPGTACARFTVAGAHTFVRGTYAEIAAAVRTLWAGDALAAYGLEGVAAELGERGFIVRSWGFGPEAAALPIARLAVRRLLAGDVAGASAHAVRPDYGGEPQYAVHDGAVAAHEGAARSSS